MCLMWKNVQTFFENEIANQTPLIYRIFLFVKFCKLMSYIFNLGSDNWIALDMAEQCHFNYALVQFGFIWILPGLLNFGVTMKVHEEQGFGIAFSYAFLGAIFFVPLTIYFHICDMIKQTPKSRDAVQT